MNSYHFKICPFGSEAPRTIMLHFMDGRYHVLMEGRFLGRFMRDESSDFGYCTDDNELAPFIQEIAKNLDGMNLRQRFPQVLKSEWEAIIRTVFLDDEFLLVFIRPEADLLEFKKAVWDKIYILVDFDLRLKIIIGKVNSDEVFQLQIN